MANQDSTIIAGGSGPDSGKTQAFAPLAEATQMGASVECPVCLSRNLPIEIYCSDCGYLLEQAAPEVLETPAEAPGRLVDTRSGQTFPVWQGVSSVGRDATDILISDGSVSRTHAQITLTDGAVIVKDLGSTNGTVVNGTRIGANEEAPLEDGQEVRFGNCILRFERITAPDQTEVAEETGILEEPETEALEVSSGLDGEPDIQPAEAEETAPVTSFEDARALLRDTQSGAVYEISEDGASIGRRDGNDIVIPNPYISSQHAIIAVEGNDYRLSDIGSTNGTLLNGKRLAPNTPQVLSPGDEIGLGPVTLVFQIEEKAPGE